MTDLPKIYCAIDTADLDKAKSLVQQIMAAGCGAKLGMEFFNAHGPQAVANIFETCGKPSIFLDLKYHDIPNTVAGAVRAASSLGVDYLNVHASGGIEMMRAAKNAAQEGAAKHGTSAPKLLAVTLLTSLSEDELCKIGYRKGLTDRVIQMAQLTQEAGLDGVVCSAHEIGSIRAACCPDFALMVPGIRPAGADVGDQKRIMTPQDALAQGATHLVIGRPITQADDPGKAAQEIIAGL